MKKDINLIGVTPQTWTRLVISLITAANQILAILGRGQIEFCENDVYQFVSLLCTLITWALGFWKNESFSKSAQAGDAVMKAIEAQTAQGELEYEAKPNPECDHNHDEVTGRG